MLYIIIISSVIFFIFLAYMLAFGAWVMRIDRKFQRLSKCSWSLLNRVNIDNYQETHSEVKLLLEAQVLCTTDVSTYNPYQWYKKWDRDYLAEVRAIAASDKIIVNLAIAIARDNAN